MAEILIVDDIPDNLKILRQIFIEQSYNVRVATDGLMAVKSATALPPDIILMDINMPKLNGIEACMKLKENPLTLDIPIIFISANAELDMVVKGLKAGGVDYITKPFMHEEVVARVEVHINLMKTKKRYANSEMLSAIGQMVVGFAHELNTPLGVCVTAISSLKGDLQQLKKNEDEGSLTKSNFEEYLSANTEVIDLIETSLDLITKKMTSFKAITLDQIDNKSRNINIHEYVEECIKLLQTTLLDDTFDITLDCENLNATLNPGYLFHIISNLISNTVDHAYEDGFSGQKKICIKIYQVENQLGIEYWDNGKGVDPDTLKQVLLPFYTSKLSDPNHLGLSASIINGIVTMVLNGTINLQSDKRGLVYNINFPITNAA